MKLFAICTFGLEKLVKDELKSLGIEPIQTEDGRVVFEGDDEVLMKANLHLRTADRVFVVMGEGRVTTFDELFDLVSAIPWETVIGPNDAFPVVATSARSTLHSEPAIQSITKKAIVKRLQAGHSTELLPENSGVVVRIVVKANKDQFMVALDSSGDALHKRGYRTQAGNAPIKETLAAAMIILSKWQAHQPFIDPFCGSGTLCIEAAMIGGNIAPGLNRSFALESWPWISTAKTQKARDEAQAKVNPNVQLDIRGSDINLRMIEIAQDNVKRANLEEFITLKTANMTTLDWSHDEPGMVVTNPPYGERMETAQEAAELYQRLAQKWKASPHDLVLITSFQPLEATMGVRAHKNRKLYNGGLQSYCYEFRKNIL